MIEEMAISLIKDVGVPVGAFIMMYALYLRTQQWQHHQQVNTEARFDKLVECFIKNIREITDNSNKALEKQTEALERNTTKLDEHVRLKDELIEFIKEDRR